MIGLFLSETILFIVVAVAGFVIGWRVQAYAVAERMRLIQRDTDKLREAWSNAQVRRAARVITARYAIISATEAQ